MSTDNELYPELLSLAALNPFIRNTSSSRATMMTSSHLGQALVVEGATKRRISSGLEREFAKYTRSISVDHDVSIIRVIPKFRPSIGSSNISENSTTLVIYERIDNQEVGMALIPHNSKSEDELHQHFGFKYEKKPIMNTIAENTIVKAGTILADSPNVDENGDYKFGIEANVAYLSVPDIIEDGVVVSRSFLQKGKTKGFERRTVRFGGSNYPLNIYGNADEYKLFPEIGEAIREDGLLFALRSHDDILLPVEMSKRALGQPDFIEDKCIYAVPGAKVVDIEVHHNSSVKNPPTPIGMEAQPKKYYESELRYHKEIVDIYDQLIKSRGKHLKLSPELHRQIVYSMGYMGTSNIPMIKRMPEHIRKDRIGNGKVDIKHKRVDNDDWTVTVTFEYDVVPDLGSKLTNLHGGKGVIVSIWEDEDMPVDKDGNRAEIIYDGDSIIKRMNVGVLYEQFFACASRDVTKEIVHHANNGDNQKAIDRLMEFYSIVSPPMYDIFSSGDYGAPLEEHLQEVLKDGIYLWMPVNNPVDYVDVVKKVMDSFNVTYDKVTYKKNITTKRETFIGSSYFLVLEKTGKDWSGVSSSKLQVHGLPAKTNRQDKYSSPARTSPIRIIGESEVRLLVKAVGSDYVADILDQSNNPTTHKEIVKAILDSDKPTSIKQVIDREKFPLGNSRSLQYVQHIMECGGISLDRTIDDPIRAEQIEAE